MYSQVLFASFSIGAFIALFAGYYFTNTSPTIATVGTMKSTLGFAGLAIAGMVAGQACQTTTLLTSIPANGTNVALQSYSCMCHQL